MRIVHRLKGKQKEQNRESKNVNLLSREINFKKFNNTKFHNEKYLIRRMLINPWHLSKYDYFVTGSDQVWNPVYKLVKYVMYLRFALKRKRIAVAASFGMSDIPEECQEIVARYLKGMHYISVRENSGKKIVEKYTNHSCDVFPDPTLLISKDAWNVLIKDIKIDLPKRYMMVYFLGDFCAARKTFIEVAAEKYNCEIVWINDDEHPEYYTIDPAEFVYVLKHSQMVVTDSFHGCVFSIVFQKRFAVFRREGYQYDMFDRIETLLNAVGLESQIKEDYSAEIAKISKEKYIAADRIISEKRQAVRKTLKSVMR